MSLLLLLRLVQQCDHRQLSGGWALYSACRCNSRCYQPGAPCLYGFFFVSRSFGASCFALRRPNFESSRFQFVNKPEDVPASQQVSLSQ